MFDLSEGVFVGRCNSHRAGIHWQELQRAYWGCYLHDFLPSQHLMHWWLWWQGLHLSVLHVWKFQTFSNVSANHIPSWLHKSDPKIFGTKEHGNTSVTPVFFVATKGIRCLMGAINKAFTKSYHAVISSISNAFTCDFWLQVIVWKMDGMIIRTMRPPEHDLKDIEYKTIISLIFCRDLVLPQTPLPDCVYCNKRFERTMYHWVTSAGTAFPHDVNLSILRNWTSCVAVNDHWSHLLQHSFTSAACTFGFHLQLLFWALLLFLWNPKLTDIIGLHSLLVSDCKRLTR